MYDTPTGVWSDGWNDYDLYMPKCGFINGTMNANDYPFTSGVQSSDVKYTSVSGFWERKGDDLLFSIGNNLNIFDVIFTVDYTVGGRAHFNGMHTAGPMWESEAHAEFLEEFYGPGGITWEDGSDRPQQGSTYYTVGNGWIVPNYTEGLKKYFKIEVGSQEWIT